MSILYRPDGVQVDHRPALPQTQRASS